MTILTKDEIQDLVALAEMATKGPWNSGINNDWEAYYAGDGDSQFATIVAPGWKAPLALITGEGMQDDAQVRANRDFICAARESVPSLCAELLDTLEQNERLAAAINMHAEAAQVLRTRQHEALRALVDAVWNAPVKNMTPEIIEAAQVARELLNGPYHDCSVGRSK